MENDQGQAPQEVLDRLFENRANPDVLGAFNVRYGAGAAEKYLNDTASATLENEALVIPESHIERLKNNFQADPRIIGWFDRTHGAGAAQSILGGGQQATPQEPKEDDTNGYMSVSYTHLTLPTKRIV